MKTQPTSLRSIVAVAFLLVPWGVGTVSAEIVWINDWDSPAEQKNWNGVVNVVSSDDDGYQAFRDLDGNGRYGTLGLTGGLLTWEPQRIAAPPGHLYTNIVFRWGPVEHHKPCQAGYSISVSDTGKFAGEEITASTPNSTGHSQLTLRLNDKPRFQQVSQIFVRLQGHQNCGWKLGGGGLVMTADILDAGSRRRVRPPPPTRRRARPLAARPFRVDASRGCVVSVKTGLSINGFARIEPEIFSLTAYEGAPDFDSKAGTKGIDFCREYGIEGIGFPANMGWVFDRNWWKTMSLAQIDAWFDEGHAAEHFRNYGAWTARYVYGRILPNLRKVGTRGFLYLYGPEPPFNGCDSGDCARKWIHVSNRYIDLCLKADPKLKYFHLFGEPNARWFRFNAGAEDYARFFNQWATETHKRFPQIKLGGPVTWGTPTRNAQWDGWCKTLLDTAHANLDFLDWHSYGGTSTKLEGDLHVVTGYGKMLYGKWIRNVVSETNINVGSRKSWHDRRIHYTKRAVAMMKQTFAFLRHPDKIFSRQFHDYAAWAGSYDARFLGDDTMPVTPMMLLYKAFKPLRGQRLVTRNPFPDVQLEAAVNDHRLCIALANTGPRRKRIPLAITGLERFKVVQTSAKQLTVEGLADITLPEDLVIDLPADSLLVAVITTQRPIQPTRSLRRWEYFGERFLTRLGPIGHWQADTTIRLGETVRRQATSATLRFGIVAQEETTGQHWEVEIDGQAFSLTGPVPFCELRLPRVPQSHTVPLRITCRESPQTTYALSFASIVLSGSAEYESPKPAPRITRRLVWSNDFGSTAQRQNWSEFAHGDPKLDTDGDQLGATVQLVNSVGSTWGTKRIEAPPGSRFSNLRVEWDVYRITPNGASWEIELSPTGRFAGEELRTITPPGVGSVRFALDASGDARFLNL